MYTKIVALATALSALAAAQEPTITAPTTLEKRYTPPPGYSASCPYVCKDYFDKCGNTFGPGCFTSCPGYPDPVYTRPACIDGVVTTVTPVDPPVVTTVVPPVVPPPVTPAVEKRYTPPAGQTPDCPYICKDYFDDCGNTYGPGCYSSCPGYPEPTFTTPVCNEAVVTGI